jgi:hypothetical protein
LRTVTPLAPATVIAALPALYTFTTVPMAKATLASAGTVTVTPLLLVATGTTRPASARARVVLPLRTAVSSSSWGGNSWATSSANAAAGSWYVPAPVPLGRVIASRSVGCSAIKPQGRAGRVLISSGM